MQQNFLKRRMIIFAICFISFFYVIAHAYAAETKNVRVGLLNYTTFMEQKDGHITGYAYEYLTDIADYTDWNYEFVPGTWNECLQRLETGEIDLLPSAQYTNQRASLYDFSAMPMGVSHTVLCTLSKSRQEYAFNDFVSYGKLVIGALAGSIRAEQYAEICAQYGFIPKIVLFDSHESQLQALRKGEVNAILISSIRCDKNLKIIASFDLNNYYFMVNQKRKDILQELNAAQTEIHARNPYYEATLYKKYYGNILTRSSGFNEVEKNYIREKGTITVAITENFPPIQYRDENGVIKGIAIDVLGEISAFTGLKFNYLLVHDEQEAIFAVTSGKADIWATAYDEFEVAESFDLQLSSPFLKMYCAMIQQKNAKHYNKDAVYAVTPYYQRWLQLQEKNLVFYDTISQCLEAVNDGKADVTYCSYYIVQYFMKDPRLNNLVFSNFDGNEIGLSFAVSKQAPLPLLGIMNKGIESIAPSHMQEITYRHLMQEDSKINVIAFIYKYPLEIILFLFFTLIGLSLIVYYRNKHTNLKQTFAEKEIYEMNLQRALMKAENANTAKTDFLSRMSHEIRTPIGVIIGLNEKAEENIQDREIVRDCIKKIKISSKHLLELINDILDMTKISAGKMNLSMQPMKISQMVQVVTTVYQELAKANQLSFAVEVDERIHQVVIGDELRLKQVLINLISNSIKYNVPQGSIDFKVTKIADLSEKEVLIRFLVHDTGIGIAKENLISIFNPFEREQNSIKRMITGTGLGLTISNQIVQLMGSQLMVESKVGKGSTFWFDVKFEVKEELDTGVLQDQELEQIVPDYQGKHFLIVEDNPLNADIISYILDSTQASVDFAENGRQACELFEQSPEGYYDVIFMDIMMPVMNGYEATKYIRQCHREDAKKMIIIALSANAFKDDQEQSLAVGMDAHCVKPIDKRALFAVLNSRLH